MHAFFAGILSFFIGLFPFLHNSSHITSSITHQPAPVIMQQLKKQAGVPQGQQPFFGEVVDIKNDTITLKTPTSPKNLIVKLTNSTGFAGGTKVSIVVDTQIAGVGSANSDGSITASQIQIK